MPVSSSTSRPTLQAPITGQALRRSVADHEVGEWTAYAQSLRIAGYRVDAAALAEQLLRHGCARVQDAFGQDVTVQVRVPARGPATAQRVRTSDVAEPSATVASPDFLIAS
jgi:hypothetical protein